MDEVLVHISAPSTSSDDARYRAQVAAIGEYLRTADQQRRQRPTPVSPGADEPTTGGSQPATHHDAANPARTSEIPTYEHIELDGPETESIGPALLAGGDQTRQPNSDRGDDSLESLVSVIPDSQPEQLRQEGQGSSPISLYYQDHSPPPALDASNKRRRLEAEVQEQTSRGTSIHADEAATTSSGQTNKTTNASPTTPTHQALPLTNTLLKNLPLQIHPPPPPISSAPFTTHITTTLAMLTDRLNPDRTYKPTAQQRQLHTLERGYWAVRVRLVHSERFSESGNQNKGIWTASFFTRFWTFLSEFIGKDARAGWGVWCFLDHDDNHHADDSSSLAPSIPTTLAPPTSTPDPVPVLLKVYTWGEIAMHIYLVLFLASERRIRGLGLQWVDSRGEVVIQMS